VHIELNLGSHVFHRLDRVDVLLSNFFSSTVGFSPPPRGSRYQDPLGWPFGPTVVAFFFGHIFLKLFILQLTVNTLYQAWVVKPALFRFKIQFRDFVLYALQLVVCILCLAWAYGPALFRFKIQFRDHILYAQVLAMCTLCLAWAYKPALLSFHIQFCDLMLCAHGLAMGTMSLAWASMQAIGWIEMMFGHQKKFHLQLAFPHPQQGLGTETP
jgi:hypothetical protein